MATSLTQYDVVHHTRAQELPAQVPGRLHGEGREDTEIPGVGELLAPLTSATSGSESATARDGDDVTLVDETDGRR